MSVSTTKTLFVTHKNCLDGTGSALMYVWAGGGVDRVLFRSPSGLQLTPQDVPAEVEEVWYADCCPEDLTDPAAGRTFRVFDHHVSSQRLHGSDPRCLFDMGECGTSLVAKRLSLTGLGRAEDELIGAIRDYDLGRFWNRAGQRLADLASTFTQEDLFHLMVSRDAEEIMYDRDLTDRSDGAAAVRRLYCDQAARSAYVETLGIGGESITIAFLAVPRDWKNDASQRVLDTRHEVALVAVFDVMGGMVSLRSRDDGPDCSRLASLFGGGGHRRAAGFRMPVRPDAGLQALAREVFG